MKPNLNAKTILVTGATGQQGGATTRHLLARGFGVRALVRDPRSPRAHRVANLGAELAVGDMDDVGSLRAAMRGAYGVFSVQPARIPPNFAENEVERGVNVADAAYAVGVQHLVYSSVAGASPSAGIPHWATKGEIEAHIRALGLPFTMLRPTLFMDMYADETYGLTGELSVARRLLPPTAIVQHVAIDDVAAFTALALDDPSRYVGKALDLAGDELTVDQALATIGRATGRRSLQSSDRRRAFDGAVERPIRYGRWHADIRSLRSLHPGLMTFEEWLMKGGAARIDELLDRTDRGRANP